MRPEPEYRIGVDVARPGSVDKTVFALFLCNPEGVLELQLIAESEQQVLDHVRELDLEREQELSPQIEVAEPELIPAELVMEWDAYGGT